MGGRQALITLATLAAAAVAAFFVLPQPEQASAGAPTMVGDLNSDGTVNSIDALFTMYYQAGIIYPSPYPKWWYEIGDVNRDGLVNSADATLILQYHAGLLDRLPPPALPPPGLIGDVDCDGRVNSIDATLILHLHAQLLPFLPCEQNGDVNGDGRINSVDAVLLIQFVFHPLLPLPPP